MKKFMMIALVAIGFIVIATPESNAGVSIGIGLGFPGGFCGYPAYYSVWLLSLRRGLLSTGCLLQQRVRALLLVARPQDFCSAPPLPLKSFRGRRSDPKLALATQMFLVRDLATQGTQV